MPARPPRQPRSSLGFTESDILTILRSPERDADLAARYACSRQSIVNIRLGRTLSHIRPDVPRRQPQWRSRSKATLLCVSCTHWTGTGCGFGFPEATTEPTFASECDYFST